MRRWITHGTTGQTDDLIYMHARFYNPVIARFLSADVLGGNPHSPQSFNLFAYVRGNPVTYWDPWGMSDNRYGIGGFRGTVTVTAPYPVVSYNPIGYFTFWLAF
ncbi:MAG: hypothetical protein GXP48_05900, partial [Acidobacteria bacterium]|nr:hypothetical protein [Acidobacteriota bacterium]